MALIEQVGVVGCGLMGAGIAEVSARAGLDVVAVETDAGMLETAPQRVRTSMGRAVRSGKLTADEVEASMARITFTSDTDALSDRELVVEAVVESEREKVKVFETLDRVLEREDAILASNTSSIPIMTLAVATERPASVIGIHFFNPVQVINLVELVPMLLTGEETAARSETFVTERLGKRVIHSKDRAGFIVNALLIPYILSAIRMFESGFATAEDIDAGMVEGCNHPMGPLALADLIGLDITAAVAKSLYEEFKEPLYAAPPLLSRMVAGGLLGRKAGRGFFSYAR